MTRQIGRTYRMMQKISDRAWEILARGGRVVIYGRPEAARQLFVRIASDAWDLVDPLGVKESRTWPHGAERLVTDTGGVLTTASNRSRMLGMPIDLLIRLEPVDWGRRAAEYHTEIIDVLHIRSE